jgi:tRNA(adenine34) deaminase
VLEPAWRECLDLAWEAYASETIPVGAVVVDPHGAVVARGRNRVYDRSSEPGQLSWSLLAHAEVNALAQLAPEPRYEDHTLLTALEPCLLCVGAARLATVGAVRFGGSDPYGGAARLRLSASNPMLDRGGFDVTGPELGPLGVLVTVLHADLFLRRRPEGFVVAAYRGSRPALIAAAEKLQGRGVAARASAGEPFTDVLPDVWDVVAGET